MLVLMVFATVTFGCGEFRLPMEGDYFLIGKRVTESGTSIVVGLCPGAAPTSVNVRQMSEPLGEIPLWRIERSAPVGPDPDPVHEFPIGRTPEGFVEVTPLEMEVPSDVPLGIRVESTIGGAFTDRFVIDDLDDSGDVVMPSRSMSFEEFTSRAENLRC